MKCPTEIAISDRREAELAKNGFMPLLPPQELGFRGVHRRAVAAEAVEYDDPDATANANLAARLPYLFACCRFAHYLKCIVRDKVGSFKERDDMQRWLQNWIMNYVDGDPAHSAESVKARKPLAGPRSRWKRSKATRVLRGEVPSPPPLPAGGRQHLAEAGVQAAVSQGELDSIRTGTMNGSHVWV
jgi:type VI secretion system ImpC/EvpB family protein